MSNEFSEKEYSSKMEKSIHSLKKDLSTLRTGRANTNMLDTIKADVYGQLMPLDQLATISVPEARLISIQVWDKANTAVIEERRKDLIKILKNMGEKSKIAIRNIRREANEELKRKLKEKIISEDDSKNFEKIVQNLTDTNIVNIEKILENKEKEIIQI